MSAHSLSDKTIFITGASRGIGKAIALRAARDGGQVVVTGKTVEPHAQLPGTIHETVREINDAGGIALAVQMDLRFEEQVRRAVEMAVERFGKIDVLVNNASAIFLAPTAETPLKRFDLMHSINARGTFLASQACLPALRQSVNPHVLAIAPPLNLEPRWFGPHVAYSMSKMGMSLCVLGMAEELRESGVAVNALWPRTGIATAAIMNLLGGADALRCCRKPEIMADAAQWIITQDSRQCTGNFFIDETVLVDAGVTDLQQYAVDPNAPLMPDFFV